MFLLHASHQFRVRKHVQAQMSGKLSVDLMTVIVEADVLRSKPLLIWFFLCSWPSMYMHADDQSICAAFCSEMRHCVVVEARTKTHYGTNATYCMSLDVLRAL
jgi:hypothetical protein